MPNNNIKRAFFSNIKFNRGSGSEVGSSCSPCCIFYSRNCCNHGDDCYSHDGGSCCICCTSDEPFFNDLSEITNGSGI